VVAHIWNSNTWEVEAGGLRVRGQPRLYSEFQTSLSYIGRLCKKEQDGEGEGKEEEVGGEKKEEEEAECWWLIPIILATQEAKIKRITVQDQPKQIVLETLSQKHPTQRKVGKVAHMGEHLPRKCEALCSNLSIVNKKR
jgi:hypothetical protein